MACLCSAMCSSLGLQGQWDEMSTNSNYLVVSSSFAVAEASDVGAAMIA